jgi:hypothetical protein
LIHWQRFAHDALAERLAFQQLHRDERLPMLVVNFVDRADVGVIEGRGSFGFALEAAKSLEVLRDIIGQEFQRDETVQLDVLGLIDDTHAAPAQLLQDAVVRDGFANHAQACYGRSVGKSMEAVELAVSQKGCWRKIAITQLSLRFGRKAPEVSRPGVAHSGHSARASKIVWWW